MTDKGKGDNGRGRRGQGIRGSGTFASAQLCISVRCSPLPHKFGQF